MDRYFFYNTDYVDQSRVYVLRKGGFAASGGDLKFGKQLGKLEVGDTLLMYENGTGIIGLGTVSGLWDGKTHRQPKYYPTQASVVSEYRIPVIWDDKVSDMLVRSPISLEEVRRRFDSPRFRVRGKNSAALRIGMHHDAAAKLVTELRRRSGSSTPSDVARDIASSAIAHRDTPTTARREIEARLGQGMFREDVLRLWKGKRKQVQCAVTGVTTVAAIRASHIKPWSAFPDVRLDPHNGIPLVATLDALFDKGLISFDAMGRMLVKESLAEEERRLLGVSESRQIRLPSDATRKYLEWHRKHFGFES